MKTSIDYKHMLSKDDVTVAIIDYLSDLGVEMNGKVTITPKFKTQKSSGFGEFDGNEVFDGIDVLVKQ